MTTDLPPVPKYRLTLVIEGNSHDEIETRLHYQANGGYLEHSQGYTRDEWDIRSSDRVESRLKHVNPEMTSERYAAEIAEWWKRRKASRSKQAGSDHD